jgi:acetyltransferase-like isoleucine patch superfamily enzyme
MKAFYLIGRFFNNLKRSIQRRIDPVGYARSIGVKVGENCRLIDVEFGSEPYLVSLGNHVSATKTRFITHDGGVWVFRDKYPDADIIAPIKVGNNVFFGAGVTVLGGVTIDDNVVVGAGAVVTKNISSNCVVAGVPARPIESLEQYLEKIQPKIINTKAMNEKQKRKFLQNYFNSMSQQCPGLK